MPKTLEIFQIRCYTICRKRKYEKANIFLSYGGSDKRLIKTLLFVGCFPVLGLRLFTLLFRFCFLSNSYANRVIAVKAKRVFFCAL